MDNQSRGSTMDHRDFQTLLWSQNEAVTMWKSLFGRLRRRKSNEGFLRTSLPFLYILCSGDKTRDKRPADLNGLKSLKEDFFLHGRLCQPDGSLASASASSRCLIGQLTSVQATEVQGVRLATVSGAIPSLNLMVRCSHWWPDQLSNNSTSYQLACGWLVACALTGQKVVFSDVGSASIKVLAQGISSAAAATSCG